MSDNKKRFPPADDPAVVKNVGDGPERAPEKPKTGLSRYGINSMTVVLLVACALFAAGMLGYAVHIEQNGEALVAEQAASISDLRNRIEIQIAANAAAVSDMEYDMTGLNRQRVDEDNELAEELFAQIMTWSDYNSYCAVREMLIHDYNVPEDGGFLSSFYPEVRDSVDNDGVKHFNEIDDNALNSRFEEMTSVVRSISDNNVYSYIATVTWSTLDRYGNEGRAKVVFLYDIDPDGNLANLDGYGLW